MREKPEECESCRFETSELTEYRADDQIGRFEGRTKWVCDLCASTETSRILDYPRQFEGQAETMRTICYVGNVLLTALRRS